MRKFTEVELVLENRKFAEVLSNSSNSVDLIFVPGYICLDDVISYRTSVGNDGNPEPFTYVELHDGVDHCIKLTIGQFHDLMQGNEPKQAEL